MINDYSVFQDREDAGQQLARALEQYKNTNAIVLGIPRGGVEIGFHVARNLNADLSIIVTRKLPLPHQPEAGFGAIAEDGSTYMHPEARQWVSDQEIERIKKEQQDEIERRINLLRGGKTLPAIVNRNTILVDDGIAMGSTMRASITMCRKFNVKKLIVGSPVASQHTASRIRELVDDIVVLSQPRSFQAVAQAYQNWYDVPEGEVIDLLEQWEKHKRDNESNH